MAGLLTHQLPVHVDFKFGLKMDIKTLIMPGLLFLLHVWSWLLFHASDIALI